jgi:hypothetical protein
VRLILRGLYVIAGIIAVVIVILVLIKPSTPMTAPLPPTTAASTTTTEIPTNTTLPAGLVGVPGASDASTACALFGGFLQRAASGDFPEGDAINAIGPINTAADDANFADATDWNKLAVDIDNLVAFTGSSSLDGKGDVITYPAFETVETDCNDVLAGKTFG